MRIIGGAFKGKKLYAASSADTRPTGGKVREAIFNIHGSAIKNARVLDLFAGTGAFGMEALSRGAAYVVFIDSRDRAMAVIKKNVRHCGVENRTKCIKWDISRDLSCIRHFHHPFNLVFMDPPYHQDLISATLNNLEASMRLQDETLMIVEHTTNTPFPAIRPPFWLADRRKYGKSLVTFIRFMIDKTAL